MRFTEQAIDDLLTAWPRLRRAPLRADGVSSVIGVLEFSMEPPGRPRLAGSYRVRIDVPMLLSDAMPAAFELDARIPRIDDEHMSSEGEMCLGSPLAVRLRFGRHASLVDYVEQCVLPFLYSAVWRATGLPGWPFDELLHGTSGVLQDYQRLLQVRDVPAIGRALAALTMRPRVANKLTCACGCNRRLGMCNYRNTLAQFRANSTRRGFRRIARDFQLRFPARSNH